MTTLREAAEKVLEALEFYPVTVNHWKAVLLPAANTLRAALAKPVQEPVEISSEWQPCVKLPVTVHVRAQRFGETHVSTREGITPVKQDDLIMRGVSGEEYPIGRKIFERTYQLGEAPPQRKPLPKHDQHCVDVPGYGLMAVKLVRAVEQAHGIKE